MTGFNKPDLHRLQRTGKRLEKALDELSRGLGELRPKQFAAYRTGIEQAISALDAMSAEIASLKPAKAADEPELPLGDDDGRDVTGEDREPERGGGGDEGGGARDAERGHEPAPSGRRGARLAAAGE